MAMVIPKKQQRHRKGRPIFWVLALIVLLALVWRTLRTQTLSFSLGSSGTVVALDLQIDPPVRIRMRLFEKETPDAMRFILEILDKPESCTRCSLYRGEPVPEYWGSEEKPDRYFDGGRWGPPYALVQGGFVTTPDFAVAAPEPYKPVIERGMVAWAGGKGGPHFFVALAEHPEWGHGHTVWATVFSEDLHYLDALVVERPLQTTSPKKLPIVTNFVDPIPFELKRV